MHVARVNALIWERVQAIAVTVAKSVRQTNDVLWVHVDAELTRPATRANTVRQEPVCAALVPPVKNRKHVPTVPAVAAPLPAPTMRTVERLMAIYPAGAGANQAVGKEPSVEREGVHVSTTQVVNKTMSVVRVDVQIWKPTQIIVENVTTPAVRESTALPASAVATQYNPFLAAWKMKFAAAESAFAEMVSAQAMNGVRALKLADAELGQPATYRNSVRAMTVCVVLIRAVMTMTYAAEEQPVILS